MSEVVGSTPSFILSGRPSASFSRSSFSLIICAAPCFKKARASSDCMIPQGIVHRLGALLVFVQQLPHLLNREWSVFAVKRLLAFALTEKCAVLGDGSAGRRFVVVVRGGGASWSVCM